MQHTPLSNHFLIAMPSLVDSNFNQTVTYICEHDENGSFGIIINRPIDLSFSDIAVQLEIDIDKDCAPEVDVYLGGPVQQNRGFIIHTPTGHWNSTLAVTDDIAITTSSDILQDIANGKGPEQTVVALGYAGWAPGQLEAELSENVWISCPANNEILFTTPSEFKWQAAANLLGIDLSLISSDTGHA